MPTALLSVYDKGGIVEFARGLIGLGWKLVSSGGTARVIADAGLAVTDVAEVTGYPAILGHRVVTLHPKIHGGLLADRSNPDHVAEAARYDIEFFDLVVVNLYPFHTDPGVELIDIGGPSMVRSAAKGNVPVVTDPAMYSSLLDELQAGGVSAETRRRLRRDAFATTAAYDAAIVAWMDEGELLPPTLHLSLERVQSLRYGENPHQVGARYRAVGASSWWDSAVQHGGKELSYLNLYDTEAAWRLVNRFDSPAGVIVKHANPCGVALAESALAAYERALDCDRVSAFGGIVAVNREVTAEVARAIAGVFTEVAIAPSFTPEALNILATKANLRTLTAAPPGDELFDVRSIAGGLLVQSRDVVATDRSAWRVVSKRQPTEAEWVDLELAWVVVAAVSSNAIVIVNDGQACGIGAGQQNRLDSARIAVERAGARATGASVGSDAFFPFRDGLDALAGAGVTSAIEPGGSVRDDDVVAAADEHNMVLVFTGARHFRH